jgi:hypothetical protein
MVEHLPLLSIHAYVGYVNDIDFDLVSEQVLEQQLVFDKGYGFRVYPNSEECRKLRNAIEQMGNAVLPLPVELVDIWAVSTDKGESVSYHSHASNAHMQPEEYWSGVVYTSADGGSAELVLHSFGFNRIESMHKIKPEVGKIVFFNSFVPHLTTKQESDKTRVAVSFNFKPVNPNKTEIPNMKIYKG